MFIRLQVTFNCKRVTPDQCVGYCTSNYSKRCFLFPELLLAVRRPGTPGRAAAAATQRPCCGGTERARRPTDTAQARRRGH